MSSSLAEAVASIGWYHTFELPGGVVTPGLFDHRRVVDRLLLPTDMTGLRCLDAASADGFFAFEMKRRGADEVISLDVDDTSRRDWQGSPSETSRDRPDNGRATRAFNIVREATGLDVERVDLSLYDISERELGRFDLVFLGNVLLHLRNPQAVLHAIHGVTDGEFVSYEAISLVDTILHPFRPAGRLYDGPPASQWWTPNLVGHRHLLSISGFDVVEKSGVLRQPFGPGAPRSRFPRRPRQVGHALFTRPLGAPSSCLRSRPRG
ncbi:MAG: class I SAM-dependent methyltransferase [Nitriliruptorales bacterium]|nr:class I SAM-dependent methyltransferase [Nitriliruptorales bacterium]